MYTFDVFSETVIREKREEKRTKKDNLLSKIVVSFWELTLILIQTHPLLRLGVQIEFRGVQMLAIS